LQADLLALIGLFRSRASLQAEILTLRHQLNVLRRKSPQRLIFTSIDVWCLPGVSAGTWVLDALKIVRPETVIRCIVSFTSVLALGDQNASGRRKTAGNPSAQYREISPSPTHCGAHHGIHGELSQARIDVGQTTVAKYMARGRRPPSQGLEDILIITPTASRSSTIFVVSDNLIPTLYGLLILHHDPPPILWLGVTAHPTAEWISHHSPRPMVGK